MVVVEAEVVVVEDYSEAKQLTQLFSTENNLLIHALLQELLVLLL